MTNYEKIKMMSEKELASFLDKIGVFETAPWNKYFSEKYCEQCKPVEGSYPETPEKTTKFSYCELKDSCRYFDHVLTCEEEVLLWLKEKVDE